MTLDRKSQELLEEVLRARGGARSELKAAVRRGVLGDEEIGVLCELVTEEFVASGLGAGDEPNERGLRLEHLVDDLNRRRIRKRPPLT